MKIKEPQILSSIIWSVILIIYKEYPLDIENLQNEEEVQTMLAAAIDRIKDEGIQKGELRKAREDALKMIQRNMSDDLIEDITGLSLSEIEELKNQIQ